jgi:hypothetical protein
MTVTKKGDLGLLRNVLMSSGTRELLISVPKLSFDGFRTVWGAHVMKSEVCLFSPTLMNGLRSSWKT